MTSLERVATVSPFDSRCGRTRFREGPAQERKTWVDSGDSRAGFLPPPARSSTRESGVRPAVFGNRATPGALTSPRGR